MDFARAQRSDRHALLDFDAIQTHVLSPITLQHLLAILQLLHSIATLPLLSPQALRPPPLAALPPLFLSCSSIFVIRHRHHPFPSSSHSTCTSMDPNSPPNYYKLFKLSPSATSLEIKSAYKTFVRLCLLLLCPQRTQDIKGLIELVVNSVPKQALQYHPDHAPKDPVSQDKAERRFRVIQQAYEVLMDREFCFV